MSSNLQILLSLFSLFLQFLCAPYQATLPLLFAFLLLISLQLYYHHNPLLNIFSFALKLFQLLHSSAYIKELFHLFTFKVSTIEQEAPTPRATAKALDLLSARHCIVRLARHESTPCSQIEPANWLCPTTDSTVLLE